MKPHRRNELLRYTCKNTSCTFRPLGRGRFPVPCLHGLPLGNHDDSLHTSVAKLCETSKQAAILLLRQVVSCRTEVSSVLSQQTLKSFIAWRTSVDPSLHIFIKSLESKTFVTGIRISSFLSMSEKQKQTCLKTLMPF